MCLALEDILLFSFRKEGITVGSNVGSFEMENWEDSFSPEELLAK